MQSPGAHPMNNGHGASVADEHVACTKQVVQELPLSHWSVTTALVVKVYPPSIPLSSLSFHWQQGRYPTGYPFTANPLTPVSQTAGARMGALGATSASPFKGQKIKIIELYTYGYRPCKRTRSQASQGCLPTLSSS